VTYDEQRLEEQAISKAAEIGLSSQLDAAEKIDVDIQTDLLKIILGQVNSVAIAGQGLVTQQGIRVQEMELHTDEVNINPLSALFGEIELNQPVDATARIVLTEEDLNRALNSNYVLSKAKNFDLNVDGKTVRMEMQQMELRLPDDEKIVFIGKTLLHETGNTQPLGFTSTFRPPTRKQPILLETFQCHEGQSVSIAFAAALIQKMKEVTNLPYFDLEGARLQIEEMEVQAGSMTLQVQAHVKQLSTQ